ncbi:MAG: Gfo/Idh/MocA family oxidoreductase [Fimbriimonadaceae bacterium]|nr:Gfo/Idh/MocA family oxidoreductase [Fimbriimonadaceae bacterium]
MSSPLRLAVLGLVHDHVWSNIPNLLQSEAITVVAAADRHEPLRAQFSSKYGGAVYETAEACLDHERPDLVLCCDTNRRSVELVELAAARGIHCVVEKPLANRLAGADRMLQACAAAGVRLVVNWPTAWQPALWHAARIVQSGELGPVWQARYHAAHNGPASAGASDYFCGWLYDEAENGPGALMDYCCYGAALCAWLQGRPEAVTAFAGKFVKDFDIPCDNAVMLLRYPGAISLLEASWTQIGAVPWKGATINCVAGALQPRGQELLISSAADPQGSLVPAEPAPLWARSLGAYTVALLREEIEPQGILSAEVSRLGQAILEAGIASIADGRAHPVS